MFRKYGLVQKILIEIKTKPFSFLAMALSMIGAYFISCPTESMRLIGFCSWIVSNIIIGLGFYRERNLFMVITYLYFEAMSILGVINNWH
jgi:hypothetical protein